MHMSYVQVSTAPMRITIVGDGEYVISNAYIHIIIAIFKTELNFLKYVNELRVH